eukprot:344469-Rhodomonas_salina.1
MEEEECTEVKPCCGPIHAVSGTNIQCYAMPGTDVLAYDATRYAMHGTEVVCAAAGGEAPKDEGGHRQ